MKKELIDFLVELESDLDVATSSVDSVCVLQTLFAVWRGRHGETQGGGGDIHTPVYHT